MPSIATKMTGQPSKGKYDRNTWEGHTRGNSD